MWHIIKQPPNHILSRYMGILKSNSNKVTIWNKDETVDPDSGLVDLARIYQKGDDKYTAVVSLTDIPNQVNKLYKIQLLQSHNRSIHWVFRSWSIIGTTIHGAKLESLPLHNAIEKFQYYYKEKCGHSWENRDNFTKDSDLCDYENIIGTDGKSKILSKPIQELIKFIFDVDIMKNIMSEFELDTVKMPLEKLHKERLLSAYGTLTELQNLVNNGGSISQIVEASNRFYLLVPHVYGINNCSLINDQHIIEKKIEIVNNLMEMEIAYSFLRTCKQQSDLDEYYKKLNTDIEVLDKLSIEYPIIVEYVKNTHGVTHSNYTLEIAEIFMIKRKGEEKRFQPFSQVHNRRLLWHGSRRTNYAGILSQGLRIAPLEVPHSGNMFGKGIYFADMVSKSANYCYTSKKRCTGLILLCEVALGEMEELYDEKHIDNLPKGKHSVKGVGKTEPDPDNFQKLHGDVYVPLGKAKELYRPVEPVLLYNEYVIYDVAQVIIRYLLKINFKYKD